MYFIDTSFLQSLTNRLDTNNTRVFDILSKIHESDKKFTTSVVVLSEYLIGQVDVAKSLKFCKSIFPKIEQITENDFLFLKNLDLNKRKSLKANDCLILAACIRLKSKLLTFDDRLNKAYAELKFT